MRTKAAATTGVVSASTAIVPPIPPPIPEIRISVGAEPEQDCPKLQ
jgi:hypothetical protein